MRVCALCGRGNVGGGTSSSLCRCSLSLLFNDKVVAMLVVPSFFFHFLVVAMLKKAGGAVRVLRASQKAMQKAKSYAKSYGAIRGLVLHVTGHSSGLKFNQRTIFCFIFAFFCWWGSLFHLLKLLTVVAPR